VGVVFAKHGTPPGEIEMGEELASKILTQTGHVAVQTSVYPISQQEMDSENHRCQRDDWSAAVREYLRDRFKPSTYNEDDNMYDFVSNFKMAHDGDLDNGDQPARDADDYNHVTFDKYLHAQVKLPRGDKYLMGKVVKRPNGNLVGETNKNPLQCFCVV
jgi:hypothetical protein